MVGKSYFNKNLKLLKNKGKFISIAFFSVQFDLRWQIIASTDLVEHVEGRELAVTQVIRQIRASNSFRDGLFIVALNAIV